MERVNVGIDAGGTKIAAGLVSDTGALIDHVTVPTPRTSAPATVEALVEVCREIVGKAGEREVTAIGLGLAGLVDSDRLVFRYGPNFPLRDVDLGMAMAEFGVPVAAGNDADCAGWAEYLYGAGDRCGDMVMVTLGTGIGGGIVSGGRPLRGANGFAGEIGHLVFADDGAPGGDGTERHWERFASGTALDEAARAAAARDPEGAIAVAAGGDPAAAHGEHVVAAAERGDAAALELMDVFAARVAAGIAGLVQVLDPARVVVGGGVCAAGDPLFVSLRRHVRRLVSGAEHRPEVLVVPAALGPHAGIIGAAALPHDGE